MLRNSNFTKKINYIEYFNVQAIVYDHCILYHEANIITQLDSSFTLHNRHICDLNMYLYLQPKSYTYPFFKLYYTNTLMFYMIIVFIKFIRYDLQVPLQYPIPIYTNTNRIFIMHNIILVILYTKYIMYISHAYNDIKMY